MAYGNNGYNSYNYGSSNPYINQGNSAQNYMMNNMSGMNMPNNGGNYNSYQQMYPMNGGNMVPQNSYQGGGYSAEAAPTMSQQSGLGKPIWVRGEMEAKMYPTKEPVWLMDSSSMTCYFKSPDMPEMKIYDMVERVPGVVQTQYPQLSMDNESAQKEKERSNYATWDALHELESKVNEMMDIKTAPTPPTSGNSNSRRGGNNNG